MCDDLRDRLCDDLGDCLYDGLLYRLRDWHGPDRRNQGEVSSPAYIMIKRHIARHDAVPAEPDEQKPLPWSTVRHIEPPEYTKYGDNGRPSRWMSDRQPVSMHTPPWCALQ